MGHPPKTRGERDQSPSLEDAILQPDPDRRAPEPGLGGTGVAAMFIGGIFVGSALGLTSPATGATLSAGVDPTLHLMMFLLFFELRLGAVVRGFGNLRFLALAWGANFLIAPLIGFTMATLFFADQSLIFIGLVIYFMSPCTDWFLGFTRVARGDTALGAALIPINLPTQLLLFPVWLWLFTSHLGLVDVASVPGALAQWFLLPVIVAQALRIGLQTLLPHRVFEQVLGWVGYLVPLVITGLILQIFAANIGEIAGHREVFPIILLAIFLFFAATFLAGEGLSRLAGLAYPQHALLTMTTAARNAPMMLAVTAVAIPYQPLVLAVLVIGMLVEFPHLIGLKQLLLWRRSRRKGLTGLELMLLSNISGPKRPLS